MTNWYFEGLQRLLAALEEATVVAATGASTDESAVFVDDVNPSLLQPGMTISSPAFPAGTTVVSVAGANVTMSAPATATTDPLAVTGVLPAGILAPVSLHAALDTIPTSPYTTVEDLTEATFVGYAPKVLVPGSVQVSSAFGAALNYACVNWTPTNYGTPNTISGIFFTIPDGVDTILLASEVFAAPVNLANPGQQLSLLPILNLPYIGGGPASPILGG